MLNATQEQPWWRKNDWSRPYLANPKTIQTIRIEGWYAKKWREEREDYKPRKFRKAYQPSNEKKVAKGQMNREHVYGALLAGLSGAVAISKALAMHESTARDHLKALHKEGRATFTKKSNVTTWKAVK